MPDFFVSDPEETLFNLRDPKGELLGTVDAIDIIEFFRNSREKAEEVGDASIWFTFFSKEMLDKTGVKISKTQAIMLVRESETAFMSLKKSGLESSDQQEPLEESSTSLQETT